MKFPKSASNKLLKIFGNKSGEPNSLFYFSKLCSCIGENNGVYDPNCEDCLYGFIYEDSPTEELVIRTSMSMRFMNEEMVHIYQGGARITIPKYNISGERTDTYERTTQGDVIVMMVDDPRRDRDICLIGKKDYLLAFHVKKVLSVSEKKKEFRENIDYKIVYNDFQTKIEWTGDSKPNSFYTVEFQSLINYMVWDDMSHSRGAENTNLPKTVMCRLRPNFDYNNVKVSNIDSSYETKYFKGQK